VKEFEMKHFGNTIRDENLLFPAKRRSDAYKTFPPSIKPGGWASHIFKPNFAPYENHS
jgi:hypothetical protein